MRKLSIVPVVALAAFALQAATYYPVTVIYDPGESIADFPVLVRIPSGSAIYSHAGTNGENLRFTDALGVNGYPHEIDTWNASGESLVWVRIPTLEKDAEFRLYCSGADLTEARDVWSPYAGVWHMNAAVDATEKDIYDEQHTTRFVDDTFAVSDAPVGLGRGAPTSAPTPVLMSKVYDWDNGTRTGRPLQVSDPNVFSFSFWFRPTAPFASWSSVVRAGDVSSSYWGVTSCGSEAMWRFDKTHADGGNVSYTLPSGEFRGWNQYTVVFDFNSMYVYMNGALLVSSENLTQNPGWCQHGYLGWGGAVGVNGALPQEGVRAIGGDFDECRIYDGVASAGRVAANYATMTNPSFLTIGPETEEQEIPEGTVAQVGAAYYRDFAEAVEASGDTGYPIQLLANGQSWTFTAENESIAVRLSGLTFTPVNGLGEADYHIAESLDSATAVTTFTLKKQVKVVAMRNVAVFKALDTRDLLELLPGQVKAIGADGTLADGDFDVDWGIRDITKYDYFGVTPIVGMATVGGMKLPVTAYVRAALSYSEGLHNIAGEASSMTVKAPGRDGYPEITDLPSIFSTTWDKLYTVTNGLAATVKIGDWCAGNGAVANHSSRQTNPYLEVDFRWPVSHKIYRIEVIGHGGNNQTELGAVELYSNGVEITPASSVVNDPTRPKIGNAFNRSLAFSPEPVVDNLTVVIRQPDQAKGNPPPSGYISLEEILIWSDGGPMDVCEASTCNELSVLEVGGKPVELQPGVRSYFVPCTKDMLAEITRIEGNPNAAPTILPAVGGVIRIVTMSETGDTSEYRVRTSSGFRVLIR